jgi:hypothetical protein
MQALMGFLLFLSFGFAITLLACYTAAPGVPLSYESDFSHKHMVTDSAFSG